MAGRQGTQVLSGWLSVLLFLGLGRHVWVAGSNGRHRQAKVGRFQTPAHTHNGMGRQVLRLQERKRLPYVYGSAGFSS